MSRQKCGHDWQIHKDQEDTGTHGVRMFCTKCKLVLTHYVESVELV